MLADFCIPMTTKNGFPITKIYLFFPVICAEESEKIGSKNDVIT